MPALWLRSNRSQIRKWCESNIMPPKYEIRLRNSFLEFSSPEPSTPWHKRSLSCPCLWGAPSDRDGGGTSSLEVEVSPASASVSTNEPQDPEAIGSGCEEDAPKSLDNVCAQKQVPCPERSTKSTRMQVKINKALQGNACSTFKVIHKELHRMNAVNLATSIHRIVRDRVPHGDEIEIFNALLVVMEKQALRELSHHDGSMPANCATIIAWSCASLQVPCCFQVSFFIFGGLGVEVCLVKPVWTGGLDALTKRKFSQDTCCSGSAIVCASAFFWAVCAHATPVSFAPQSCLEAQSCCR